MTSFVFTNNVNTTLAASISSTDTTITLASSSNLPASIPSGYSLALTLSDAATRSNFEVVYANGPQTITGSTLTVARAQEGTTALGWGIGDYVFNGPTKGQMESFGLGSYVPLTGNSTITGVLNYSPTSGNATQTLNAPVAGSTYAGVIGQSVGSTRWIVKVGDESAQSGSNNGANLTISRYTDLGALIDTPVSISRATGNVTLTTTLTATAVTAPTGTFATSVSCGTLTASGAISGTSASFTGSLASAGLTGTTATFSGALTCLTFNATASDRNLKTNIQKFEPRPLHRKIDFYSYEMIDSGFKGWGPIAQQAKKHFPGYVGTFKHKGKQRLSVYKADMAYEQSMWAGHAIDRLEKAIEKLSKRLDKLEAKK